MAAKPLADVLQNLLAAAKLPYAVVLHLLAADALQNLRVAAKPLAVVLHLLTADAVPTPLVAAKPLADVLLNQLVAAKFLPADAVRSVAVCSLTCSANTSDLAANQLADAKRLLAAKAHRHVVAKLPLLADATADATSAATRLVAAAKRSAADC